VWRLLTAQPGQNPADIRLTSHTRHPCTAYLAGGGLSSGQLGSTALWHVCHGYRGPGSLLHAPAHGPTATLGNIACSTPTKTAWERNQNSSQWKQGLRLLGHSYSHVRRMHRVFILQRSPILLHQNILLADRRDRYTPRGTKTPGSAVDVAITL